MEKRQAKDYIKEVLNQSFNSERFELFIRNLLNDIEPRDNSYSGNLIPEAFRDHIAHYKRIGKYTDPEGEELDILIIQTRSVKKLERTRTALRNFLVRHLKTFDKQYALAAFYSKEDDGAEWRFSLVKIDYETKKGEKGKIKVEEELVPAKRFSFLVGKYEDAHTAQKQLLPILTNDHANPLIVKEKDGDGSIEGAFSIQKVTDEFYERYKELYLKLAENKNLTQALKEENLDIERFVKKLLGQIVFLYFLQKKGWLGVSKDQKMGEGSKRFLQERFDLAEQNGESYYNDFLRYLFYEALAKEHNDEGVTYYFKKLGCRIPFLNGGLFEASYNWKGSNFTLSNKLFRNEEKNKAGDKGTGILDVFDRYNFTIKEDEPLEKEVAVDPEMLGKVFENMLDIKERKSKGAYYTPREIVHYMCQESLIHYLDNTINDYTESYQPLGSDQNSMFGGSSNKKGNLNLEIENKGDIRIPKEDIEEFIRKGHLALEHEATVQSKGKETDSYKFKLPENIRTQAANLDQALADIKICDPAIGSGAFPVGLLHEIVTARQVLNSFLQREGYSPYYLKRHAIQESIYGVDIDVSAIDIARLRLWLSMIVDEEDYDSIDALPNLDYKIVQGNALIGLPGNAMRDLEVEEKLEELKEEFFAETNEIEKKKLRKEINSKIRELLNSAEEFAGYHIDFDFKLYFSEVWRHNNGFDILIGNPPYKIEYDVEFKSIYEENFNTFKRNNDIYIAFFQQALRLIKHKGSLIFITPNTYLNGDYFKEFRKLVTNDYSLEEVVDFKNHSVFRDPTVFVAITHITKRRNNKESKYKEYQNGFNNLKEYDIQTEKGSTESLIPKHPIYDKVKSSCQVEFDDVFLIKDVGFNYWTKGGGKNRKGKSIGKRVFIKERINENDIPYITGSNIKPYFVKEGNSYLRHDYKDYLDNEVDTFRFSENILRTSPKICYRQTSDSIIAGIDYDSQLCNKTVHVVINKKGGNFDLKYILGVCRT
jgi:methylase of polypeptide subunit release factors